MAFANSVVIKSNALTTLICVSPGDSKLGNWECAAPVSACGDISDTSWGL
jgi:hypothetical protein